MCNKIKIINQTSVGSLSKCSCGLYVLQFNNVFLEFDKYELLSFKNIYPLLIPNTGILKLIHAIVQFQGKYLY